jgi:hypothetical protein
MSIELRFVDGDQLIPSGVIKYLTRCDWSHVEAITGQLTYGAQLAGGVRWRTTQDPCYDRLAKTELVELQSTDRQFTKFWDFMGSQLNRPYDWRAILSFGLGERDWRAEDSWFCSELVIRALEVAELVSLPASLPVDRITPRDVWLLARGLS